MEPYLLFHSHEPLSIHMGVSGSIAAYRALDLLRSWKSVGLNVEVTLTPSACKFVTPLSFSALGASSVNTDMFNNKESSPFVHLEPCKTAQSFIVAPASASTITRIAYGMADDLLACQALAYPGKLIIAPAMNPYMWNSIATQKNIAILRERGCIIIEPSYGCTACEDEGMGRLADIQEIYIVGLQSVTPQDYLGKRVLVTLGPTYEYWDNVRFFGSPSTGIMGSALAVTAWLRGAEVHAICGPRTPWLPSNIKQYSITSAQEMFEISKDLWPSMDIGLFTAAVSDFSPERCSVKKFKKGTMKKDNLSLSFNKNVDILKVLSSSKQSSQRIMGFAAEAEDLQKLTKEKLYEKKLDMIVGNSIDESFGSTSSSVFVYDRHGREEFWSSIPKTDIAWKVLSWLQML